MGIPARSRTEIRLTRRHGSPSRLRRARATAMRLRGLSTQSAAKYRFVDNFHVGDSPHA
jgi:hypothetical protein